MREQWTVTMADIYAHKPCTEGWAKLRRFTGLPATDTTPFPLLTVLESNGLDDALWCLRAVQGRDREIRLFAAAARYLAEAAAKAAAGTDAWRAVWAAVRANQEAKFREMVG